MEASQAGQTGDGSTQVSQETPSTDSNLQTPQADQPVPPETERTGEGQETQPTDGSTAEANAADAAAPQDAGTTLQTGDPFRRQGELPPRDQAAEEAKRQAELDAARQLHNERTGGGEVQPGELQQAQQDHNDRVGGGQVVQPSSGDEPQGD